MRELTFYKNYKNNDQLRHSFNELAHSVFGISFEEWYERGYWNDRYIPFSYADGTKIVANVSVNLLDFIINGEEKSAIQIGTVMTHPEYRNRGLSAQLMNLVLEEYEQQYDFIYLFANQSVLDFYPKFGFQAVQEAQFSVTCTPTQPDTDGIRKLNSKEDLNLIYQIASERVPVSNRFGTVNTASLLLFYCLYVFPDDIYYVEKEEAIVIYKSEGTQIDIYDIVSKNNVNMETILSKITNAATNKIFFHFTPDFETKREHHNGEDVLFVKTKGKYPTNVKHPITSKA